MTGRTVAEKILARASRREEVRAGEVVDASPDLVMSHENTFLVSRSFSEFHLTAPWDPDKIVIVLDHRTPANTATTAAVHARIRLLVKEIGFLGLDPNIRPGYESLRYVVRIKGDGTAEDFQAIHENVMKTSPNYFNITRPIRLDGTLVVE